MVYIKKLLDNMYPNRKTAKNMMKMHSLERSQFPEIAIIIPAYNAERTLGKCVKSVQAQSFTNWELIIVDDGSSDATSLLCADFASEDYRIHFTRISNSGPGAARNKGICLCRAKWLTFLDADDVIEPKYLSNFHHYLLSDGDLSVQGYKRMKDDGFRLPETRCFSDKYYRHSEIQDCLNSVYFLDYGQSVGKLFYTQTIKNYNINFPVNFRLSEDHYFFFSYLLHVNGVRCNDGMLYHYIDWNGITSLSQRTYPYTELMNRYQSLVFITNLLIMKHGINNDSALRLIDDLAYTGSISLLLQSLYAKSACTSQQRQAVLSDLHNKWRETARHFHPKSFPGKVVKYLLFAPVCVSDRIFQYAFKRKMS